MTKMEEWIKKKLKGPLKKRINGCQDSLTLRILLKHTIIKILELRKGMFNKKLEPSKEKFIPVIENLKKIIKSRNE